MTSAAHGVSGTQSQLRLFTDHLSEAHPMVNHRKYLRKGAAFVAKVRPKPTRNEIKPGAVD